MDAALPKTWAHIYLDKAERDSCVPLAKSRQKEAERLKCRNYKLSKSTDLEIHLLGVWGEWAYSKFARAVGTLTLNTFKESADVDGIEIRTRSLHRYELIIRPDDHLERSFVLITTEHPQKGDGLFIIKGWLPGKLASSRVGLKSHGGGPPAWFVPAHLLYSIRELVKPLTFAFDRKQQGILL